MNEPEKDPRRPVFETALRARCPRCGDGPLFQGFLTVRPRCEACRLDFSRVDTGDGPAVFVIFVIGILIGAGALWLEIGLHPPVWAHMALWTPLTLAGSLALLRPFKAALIALQYKYRAEELHLDE